MLDDTTTVWINHPSPYLGLQPTHLATLSTIHHQKPLYLSKNLFILQTFRILTPLLHTTHSLWSCLLILQPTLSTAPTPILLIITLFNHQVHPPGQNANLRSVQRFPFAEPSAGTQPTWIHSIHLSWHTQVPFCYSIQLSVPFLVVSKWDVLHTLFKHLASHTPDSPTANADAS